MNEISLELIEREIAGKKTAKLRGQGQVPSVVYGGKSAPLLGQSPIVETTKVVRAAGRHTPVRLTIGGKKKLAMIKRVDIDPVKHAVRHVAFHAIKQNEKIVTSVPLAIGSEEESEAKKQGLVILQTLDTIDIRALPSKLPESLELSAAGLEGVGDKLTVADIVLPEGVEFANLEQDESLTIASVYEPSALQAAEAEETEAQEEEATEEEGAEAESPNEASNESEPETSAK